MDWIPVVLVTFKFLVLVTGMFFAINELFTFALAGKLNLDRG